MSRIQILGASYGSVLAAKLLLAGHEVSLVCTPSEVDRIVADGISVLLPLAKYQDSVWLHSRELPGELTATTPDQAGSGGFDLVVLAIQEPQFQAPELRGLISRIARAGTPCLSIMNMPPPPFLARFPSIDVDDCLRCYTEPTVWSEIDPDLITHCSADVQASRSPNSDANALEVRLATNFRAAPFAHQAHTRILDEIATSVDRAQYAYQGRQIDLPVRLKVYRSPYVAISKWPMLITGNYRCITPDGIRPIEDAVHGDIEASRRIYSWVCGVCQSLGAAQEDLVPFEKYAAAAHYLKAPSSAARAMNGGVPQIERMDYLIQTLAAQIGIRLGALDQIVDLVDRKLAANRMRSFQ